MLQWASQGCPWNEDTCSSAAAGGHREALKFERHKECPRNGRTCMDAAEGGHV